MNNRCTFKRGKFNCGSYAFSLYQEGIKQGDYCDHHYWQDKAMKAAEQERKACAKIARKIGNATKPDDWALDKCQEIEAAIRARGTT